MVESEHRGWTGLTDLPAKRWVLVTGNRTHLTAIFLGLLAGLMTVFLVFGIVYVGPNSTLPSVLASGMLGGLATIVTVTLSINQLILSRVFGTPAELTDRLEGNLEFRRSIEDTAEVATSPNDPGSFLSLIADTLKDRAARLDRAVSDGTETDDEVIDDVKSVTEALVEYADHLNSASGTDSTFEVLSLTFGTEYADHIDDVRRLNRGLEDRLPDAASSELHALLTLLKGVATIRQFFKTLAVQQDLARLSRQLIYTGVPAILTAYFLAPVYTGPSVEAAIPAGVLPWVVVPATLVMFAPLFVLVSYLLRVATVTLYTVSVGSFIPPEERVNTS